MHFQRNQVNPFIDLFSVVQNMSGVHSTWIRLEEDVMVIEG
jgi:hypothetical protein